MPYDPAGQPDPTMKATVPAREAEEKSSVLTVIIAFCAKALVAVAQSVAAVMTGSASMTAEAAHSWADTGNNLPS